MDQPDMPERTKLLQHAYLLEQAAEDGGSQTAGALNKKISSAARKQLGLTNPVATELREELSSQGYLEKRKAGRSVYYTITATGGEYLGKLEKPTLTGRSKPEVVVNEQELTEEVRNAQQSFLLLQLLNDEKRTLTKGEANKVPKQLAQSLDLKPALANHRRARLAEQGYLSIKRSGRSEEYTLTSDGLDYLTANTTHLVHVEYPVTGRALNALITAARERSFGHDQPARAESTVDTAPETSRLAEAVLEEFQELRREHHGRSGLVPIHEVRQRIIQRFGSAAGRHDVLDEIVLSLWREGRLELLEISDLGSANEQQLNDSIPTVNGTFFYLEVAREQPALTEPV